MPTAVGIIADSYKAPSGTFSPLSIPWHSAFWASDPSWIPPADGGAVSDWKNSGTSAANATQSNASFRPVYRAVYANLNGKPAVEFALSNMLTTAAANIAQPNHIFAVAWLDPTAPGSASLFDAPTNRHFFRPNQPAGSVSMYAGSAPAIALAGRTGTYAASALYNGASSTLRMNGTSYTVPSTVGTLSFSNFNIGSYDTGTSLTHKGAIAFFGVSDTELTAQQITDLETWANTYYGVPIAPVPAQISGLLGWWDASDLALADGASVTTWSDKSGAGRTLTAVSAAPIFKTNIQNGKSVVRFDGTKRTMQTATTGIYKQVFLVGKWATANFNGYPGLVSGTSGGASAVIYVGDGGTTKWYTPVAMTYYRDGADLTSTLLAPMQSFSAMSLSYATGWNVTLQLGEDRAQGSPAWNGDVAELIAYDHILTTTERQQVESYLKTKWNTP